MAGVSGPRYPVFLVNLGYFILEPLLLVGSCVGCWALKRCKSESPVSPGVVGGKVGTRLPTACLPSIVLYDPNQKQQQGDSKLPTAIL